MAKNNRSMKEAEEQVRFAERQLAKAKLEKKRSCFHNQVSDAHLVPISESRLPDREKQKYSDTTYICDNCGDIFEANAYDQRDIDRIFFDIHSALAQIQLLVGAKLDDQERAELEDAFEKADDLEKIIGNFYLEMVKLMSKGNNKGGKKKTSKGGIGISSGMMR